MTNSKARRMPILWKALLAGTVAAILVTALLAVPALAGGSKGKCGLGYGYGYRHGWGWGDDNHTHTGPPGLVGKDIPGNGPNHGDNTGG